MRPAERLSPRQRSCLELVWQRQATSKEIAAELGISKATVDGYVAEAVELLGARDRRDAARIAFGDTPRAALGDDPARVPPFHSIDATPTSPSEASSLSRPWRTGQRPTNTLTFVQTIGLVVAIAIGSMMALALAISIGSGLPKLWVPLLHDFRRVTH